MVAIRRAGAGGLSRHDLRPHDLSPHDRRPDHLRPGDDEGRLAPVVPLRPRQAQLGPESRERQGSRESRQRLHLVEGRGESRATFVRRRLACVVALALMGALGWLAVQALFAPAASSAAAQAGVGAAGKALHGESAAAGAGGHNRGALAACQGSAAPALSGAGAGAAGCGLRYVVAPGDTIWAIATRYSAGGDPRPLEAALESEIGGGVLQPGQMLTVP